MNRALKNTAFIKSVLMITVILGHSLAYWSGTWITELPVAIESKSLNFLFGWINSFHVYAFTAISGLIFAYKMARGGYSKFHLFLVNKGRRLLIPYVFVATIWVIPVSIAIFKWDIHFIFKHFILCTGPSQLWFLWMLFDVFVIAWLFWKYFSGKPIVCWSVAVFLFLVGKAGSYFLENYFGIWTAFQYTIFFVIGIRLYILTFEEGESKKGFARFLFKQQNIPFYVIADLLLYVVHIVVLQNEGGIWKLIDIGIMLFLHCVGTLMAILVLNSIANKINYSNSKVFTALSCNSMPMYLFHQQIIYFTIYWLNGKVNPYLHAGINFVVALVCSFLISSLLMRWKVTRFLIGEKA